MKIINLEEIDSTQKYLKNIDIDDSVIAFCEKQTSAYGQYNRVWYTSNDSLAFSYKYNSKKLIKVDEESIKKITLNFSKLINDYFNVESYLKLPNDIYLNQKKLCGILIETKYFNHKITSIIIGIGLNINNEMFPVEIKDIATSIYLETNKKYDINDFKDYLCTYFEDQIIKE